MRGSKRLTDLRLLRRYVATESAEVRTSNKIVWATTRSALQRFNYVLQYAMCTTLVGNAQNMFVIALSGTNSEALNRVFYTEHDIVVYKIGGVG
jgi:hypothetical protein